MMTEKSSASRGVGFAVNSGSWRSCIARSPERWHRQSALRQGIRSRTNAWSIHQSADHVCIQQRVAGPLHQPWTIPALSGSTWSACLVIASRCGWLSRGSTLNLTAKTARFDELARIDVSALGVSREKHHRYLLGDSATSGFIIHAGSGCVGYVYISDGHIGPLAVGCPGAMGGAFAAALSFAARSNAQTISAFLPGASEPALKAAIDHGMRITFPMLLMSSRQFGNWNSYLPRNPGFM